MYYSASLILKRALHFAGRGYSVYVLGTNFAMRQLFQYNINNLMVFYNEETVCVLGSWNYYLYDFQASARKYTFFFMYSIPLCG
jgi:hypothetical protein